MTNKKVVLHTVTKSEKDNEKERYLRALHSLGFSQNEAVVYVFLLEQGKEIGGSKIALATKLHRQYVYLSLPKLLTEGLIEEIGGIRKKYKAKSPVVLESLGRKQALRAHDAALLLQTISNIGNEQDFDVIQGEKAFRQFELDTARRKITENEYIIGGASEKFSALMGDDTKEYLEIKRKHGIRVRYLGTENEKSMYDQLLSTYPNQEYRFLTNLPQGSTHMVIRDESVSFYSFLTPPLIYTIYAKEVARNYRDFFMMLWNMAV